ncbi:MAG: hypothetical protein JSR57_11820, partial [Verrucomicrobia bacterium]|nr:hypothetical protein [Verrucomicrobiota bacterium]
LLQLCAIYLLPDLFKTVPMTLSQWKYPLITFIMAFGLVELRKWIELARFLMNRRKMKPHEPS